MEFSLEEIKIKIFQRDLLFTKIVNICTVSNENGFIVFPSFAQVSSKFPTFIHFLLCIFCSFEIL